ncbi:septum formation initiator family protein [Streptomyces sp. NBC_00059]|uniref:FtsB family cell division protein n=1 Tax=Streptomyces sp. NBC_00059 TaxID=2975635 RepID=UPI00224CC154|nr:septum formation initiator family protein [Streptomyces sp. NBC_00059]MCX5413160.1 septum formation initiator family protein [Streptomyces sp. NBC_00059]
MTRTAEQMKGRAGRLARLMPSGPSTAARTPFVLLVVLLLAGGLISLLLLNSALNEGSFRLSKLERETTELTDEQQALQRDVDSYSEPDALERRARELGMVPGGSPAFLNPDGTVRGVPERATAAPSPTASPEPSASASPSGSPSTTATSTAAASATPAPSAPTSPSSPSTSPGR